MLQNRNLRIETLTRLAVILLIIFIAWPFRFYFLNDDLVHIPLAAEGKIGHNRSIRYIGDISLILDYFWFGKSAWGYHLTNLLIHLANFLLFSVVLKNLFASEPATNIKWALLYAAVAFGLFGFHSDAVFWIIGRSASLGCLFFLLTILCFQQVGRHWVFGLLVVICWGLSLFSYESVIILPMVLTLYKGMFTGEKPGIKSKKTTLLILLWVILLLYFVYRKFITGAWLGHYEAAAFEQWNVKVLAINYLKLLARTFFPPLNNPVAFMTGSMIFLASYSIICFKVISGKRGTLLWYFLHACWLLSYIPYLSLGISASTIESERFLYLPSLFFCISFFYSLALGFKNTPLLLHSIGWIFILFQLIFFWGNAIKYSENGTSLKTVFESLQKHENLEVIEVKNLPSTVYGIPVLRSGFAEGYYWLCSPENQVRIVAIDTMAFPRPWQNAEITPVETRSVRLTFSDR